MPGENEPQTDPTENQTTQPTDPPATQPAAAADAAKAPKVLTIPTSAMSRIKKEAREQGKKQALEELNAQARALGFKDFESMKAAAQRRAAPPAKPERGRAFAEDGADEEASEVRPAKPVPAGAKSEGASHPRLLARLEREKQQLLEEKRRLNKRNALADRRTRELQRQLDAKEAEAALKLAAFRAGIVQEADVDYALGLLRRECQGKTAKDLESFDEAKFFADLRQTRPYLFGETERPANTAPTQAAKDPKPPVKADPKTALAAPKDALKMTQEEFQAHLRAQGLTLPNGSFRA